MFRGCQLEGPSGKGELRGFTPFMAGRGLTPLREWLRHCGGIKGFATAADTPVAVGVVIFIVMWLWNVFLSS